MGCRGEVYQDTSAAGPIVRGTYRVTSRTIDNEIVRHFASMMGRSASEQLKVPQSIPALRRFNPPGFPQN